MQATRERILSILKEQGQVTVSDLSDALGLTAVTVRHHLDIMRGEGLVAAPVAERCKSPGRPKHVYTLSEQASGFFPKRYKELVAQILDEMRARISADEIDQMMQRLGERLADHAVLPAGMDFDRRVAVAIEFLDKLGYMPSWERSDDGSYLIYIANCPYEQISRQDDVVCKMDMALLTRLLGAPPRRISSASQGDHLCTYVVNPPDA